MPFYSFGKSNYKTESFLSVYCMLKPVTIRIRTRMRLNMPGSDPFWVKIHFASFKY